MKRGKFIVIDGIDGSGKGTVAKKLAAYLFDKDKQNHVFLTREPYISKYRARLRNLLKRDGDPKNNGGVFTDLFIKDRKVHAAWIKKELKAGHDVICDRYKYSTLAYQWAQGIPIKNLIKKHQGILIPALAVIIDVPVKTALKRIARDGKRPYNEIFEQENFMKLLGKNFLSLSGILKKENIVVVDGNKNTDAVFRVVKRQADKII
ncbi:MAG: dTMP kinase [Candidatus Pacebacteria bacterium]|nr:dTMP kinase [Candidatus Paceibacterota bacterium]